ncbi:tyrosine-type recombinase/integrase [Silvimonas sp. JCM 19000]
MARPKTSGSDLPLRMVRRIRKRKDGSEWTSYYYSGRDDDGRRIEIPLGQDINEAKRLWAQFEHKETPVSAGTMRLVFERYERDIVPAKSPATQRQNLQMLKQLRPVFDNAPIDAITPQHIAQYRDRRTAKVRANREIALLSHVFNMAREWGYTARDNPARGIRKNREVPRDFYADATVWTAVYEQAVQELRDAMDLNYLTGQRPADVLKMMERDIRDDALEVRQNKTNKRLRILLNEDDGSRTELGKVIDRIRARTGKVKSFYLVATAAGAPLSKDMLRDRFDAARLAARAAAEQAGDLTLSERIKAFQFRDIRPKAASEMGDLTKASKLLGHTEQEITRKVYIRVGETVKPTK